MLKAQRAQPGAVVGLVPHADVAGQQRAVDKDHAVHRAVAALELQPALGRRCAAAPAAQKGFGRHRHAVARVTGGPPALGDEAVDQAGLVVQQLARKLGMHRLGDRRCGAATRQQGLCGGRRHQEADLLAITPGGHVDADQLALFVERRAAAHARVERAAEKQRRQVVPLGQAVESTFGDGEADIQRVAQREHTCAARQHLLGGAEVDDAAASQRGRVDRLQQGQIVHHIEGQQLQRTLLAVDRGVDQPVAAWLPRVAADHVVIGDQVALGADQKARAHRRLAVLGLEQGAHLHQPGPRIGVDALAGAGRQGDHGSGRLGCADRYRGGRSRCGAANGVTRRAGTAGDQAAASGQQAAHGAGPDRPQRTFHQHGGSVEAGPGATSG